jgi:phosphoribosylanthranilate isomerase
VTRIKICGITNAEDAALAIQFGADALGFILVPESKRYVPADQIEKIVLEIRHPGPFTSIVAVAKSIADARNVDIADCAQYYVGSPLDSNGRQHLIPVLRVKSRLDLARITSFASSRDVPIDGEVKVSVQAILLDTYTEQALGGAGKTFDWSIARDAVKLSHLPIIVAGGLSSDNVTQMLDEVQPYAVDVSSGVEESPGKKDPAKLRDFIQAVRAWDCSRS